MKHYLRISINQLPRIDNQYATPASAMDHINVCRNCPYDDCKASPTGVCDLIIKARKGEKK